MKLEHLGGGVVLFEDAFDLDWDWMRSYSYDTCLKEKADMYEEGVDPLTGVDGYINKSGYFFSKSAIDEMPWRASMVHSDSRPEVVDVLESIESARDRCLIEFLHLFP